MKTWTNKEVKSLFSSIEESKQNNQSLKAAFDKHAKNFGRKTNSVRNYYYQEINNLYENKTRCDQLQIDLSKHAKSSYDNFDSTQENELVEKIDAMISGGFSVRAACNKLAEGNLTLLTRFQNKYQSHKRKNKSQGAEIIKFQNRQRTLTENDINSLFMGLVRLIKKTAIDEFMEKSKLEKDTSTFLLKKAFTDLNKKDRQISDLRKDFEELKSENEKMRKSLMQKQSLSAFKIKEQILKKKNEDVAEELNV